MAHPRHEFVRARYAGRCGYCGVTEGEAGGELTVDHFRPESGGGDDSDDNLVYSCFRCNTYKADFTPTPDDLRQTFRILHPLLDDIAAHLRENSQTGAIEPLTETGRFHVALLRLNRPQLRELRLTRGLNRLLAESCKLLQEENEQLRAQIAILEEYLVQLRRGRIEGPE
ncbi:MAG: HNH endonuclease [Planctomycetes bacterium]|nr:HNH endonuclease [Planctomycetota bacterium]